MWIDASVMAAINSAIKSKTGETSDYDPEDMPTAINGISTAVLGTKTITANGTYNASSDGYDGYSSVTVNVASGGGSGDDSGGGSGDDSGSGSGDSTDYNPPYIPVSTNPIARAGFYKKVNGVGGYTDYVDVDTLQDAADWIQATATDTYNAAVIDIYPNASFELSVNSTVTLDGTIDGGSKSVRYEIRTNTDDNVNPSYTRMTLKKAFSTGPMISVTNGATLTTSKIIFDGGVTSYDFNSNSSPVGIVPSSEYGGGIISSDGGDVSVNVWTTIQNVTLGNSNGGNSHGCAVYNPNGKVSVVGDAEHAKFGDISSVVKNCYLRGNGNTGAAIYANEVSIGNYATIENCRSDDDGAGVYALSWCSVGYYNNCFNKCWSTNGSGAAIYVARPTAYLNESTCWVQECDFTDCGSVSGNFTGGAICAVGGVLIRNTYIESGFVKTGIINFTNCGDRGSSSGNGKGGAIYTGKLIIGASYVVLSVESVDEITFTNCGSDSAGGAIYVTGRALFRADTTRFVSCDASNGKAMYIGGDLDVVAGGAYSSYGIDHTRRGAKIYVGNNLVTSNTLGSDIVCNGTVNFNATGQ